MGLACLLVLVLLCGIKQAQQAPKQSTRRSSIVSLSLKDESKAEENESNLLSRNVENLLTHELTHRRQNVIELVRNLSPSAATNNEPTLEKHSTIRTAPDVREYVKNDKDDTLTGVSTHAEDSEKYSKEGSDSSGLSKDDMNNDHYQDEDEESGDENEGVTDEETVIGDSVAPFIDTYSVSGTSRDVIPPDKTSAERDPVASYLAWNTNHEKNGNLRDVIEETDEDQTSTDHDNYTDPDGKVTPSAVKASRRDSVASYITGSAPEIKEKMPVDSVSPYIDDLGTYRDKIEKTEHRDGNINIKHTRIEAPDSFKVSGSGDDDDDDVGDENSETVGENSAEDESSGDDDFQSSKAQAILEGLEEDLFQDSSSGEALPSKEKLTFKSGSQADEKLDKPNFKKTKPRHHPSYVAQQPYGVPIQYNIPHYTPQYIYVSVTNAERKGAVCLDGSTPGYFYRRGVGRGEKRWILYLQGGAWCDSKEDCYERSTSNLGSSLKFTHLHNAEGLLSRDDVKNPNFYNWNVVYVPYCDGASYTGNRSDSVVVKGRRIYFRGKRILSALLDDLLSDGLSDAEKVIFSGTSAGGLAVLLNADYVRSRLPSKVNLYSLADAGIFLDLNDTKGKPLFPDSMKAVYELHQSSGSINPKCKTHQGEEREWKCLFPYYFGEYIETPLFIINPLHDSWQLANVVGIHCAYHPRKCDEKEMKAVKTFRDQTLNALDPFMKNPHVGIYADGCVDHGQIVFSPKWTKILVKNRSMSGTFARWINNEENIKSVIDVQANQYPFNPTCDVPQLHG